MKNTSKNPEVINSCSSKCVYFTWTPVPQLCCIRTLAIPLHSILLKSHNHFCCSIVIQLKLTIFFLISKALVHSIYNFFKRTFCLSTNFAFIQSIFTSRLLVRLFRNWDPFIGTCKWVPTNFQSYKTPKKHRHTYIS